VQRELEEALSRDTVGAVWYGDDIAFKGQLMVSPEFLNRVFFPRLTLLAGMCRSRNVPFLYHTDGEVTPVLEDIIAAGVNVLHPIDPTCMDIRAVKQAVSGRLALAGNVDVDLLIRGERDEVIEATRRCLEDLAPGGGYILGSSNSIPRNVNIQNYRAMLDTARTYEPPRGATARERPA
jgi:uroporphyrinogen decarboxylase